MNPKTVLDQSIAASVLLVALALCGRPLLAGALAAAGGAWALVLNARYARRVGTGGRSARRIEGDRAIARQLLVSYAIPLLGAALVGAAGRSLEPDVGPIHAHEVQGLLGTVATMLVVWLASSHVDWYYIRCMSSRDTRWKGVTRKWYIHRAIASLATMGAIVVIALITTMVLDREWPNALAQVGGFAAIFGAGIWLMRDEIRSAAPTSRSIRSPQYWLGDDLTYETDRWDRRGFVLHVAIPVTKLVSLAPATGELDGRGVREEPSSLFMDAHLIPRGFTACRDGGAACGRVNRECTWRSEKVDVGRRRLIIV
jgi:hypothetical protein